MTSKTTVAAPAPDPALTQATIENANRQTDLSSEWLNFQKQSYADGLARQDATDALTNAATQQQMGIASQQQQIASTQAQWATEDRNRITGVFRPLQDAYIEKANNWDSAGRQQQVASEARADVLNAAAIQQQSSQRNMASMGINPTSGRYAGVDRAGSLATGLAAGGAANNARAQTRTQGLALQESAINLGNGLAASGAQSTGAAVGAGQAASGSTSAAVGSNAAGNSNFYTNAGQMSSGYGNAISGLSSASNSLMGIYNSQQSGYQNAASLNQKSSAANAQGAGSLIGLGLSAASMFL